VSWLPGCLSTGVAGSQRAFGMQGMHEIQGMQNETRTIRSFLRGVTTFNPSFLASEDHILAQSVFYSRTLKPCIRCFCCIPRRIMRRPASARTRFGDARDARDSKDADGVRTIGTFLSGLKAFNPGFVVSGNHDLAQSVFYSRTLIPCIRCFFCIPRRIVRRPASARTRFGMQGMHEIQRMQMESNYVSK
jgi:hypothetical protein